MLSFLLLGQASLYQNGVLLSGFRSKKEAALLIYLAQTGQAQRREFLANMLWDGRSTSQGLGNLRTALARVQRQVGDTLRVTPHSLELVPESLQQVDSQRLLNALASFGQVDSDDNAYALERTLATYHGDFLADFHLSDAPQFTEWAEMSRAAIRRQVVDGYDRLTRYFLATGEVERGITAVNRRLQVDALDESAHMHLIQLLINAGRISAAVAHHNHSVALLRSELDIEPSAELKALVCDLQRNPVVINQQSSTPAVHNLPVPHDQFFGRVSAQEEIHARLDQPWCRLVTIVGLGGVGKTRLATTIAHTRLDQYRDGVWLVDLTDIDADDENPDEAIAVEIATMLDLRLSGPIEPAQQLLEHLRHKQMLLLLDNFDVVLDGIQIVHDIVQHCDEVQLLVTSREALQLRAEWKILLSGLIYPESATDEMPCAAVDLFLARHVQQRRGDIAAAEHAAVREICRMVEGLPLAIELAAGLTSHTTARQIADELRNGLDALKTSLRDVPLRHRSLRIVFEMSWRTLTPLLQQRLAQLTVFRSGFTQYAAWDVVGADGQQLVALVDKSLLYRDMASSRYSLHVVVAAFAAEKRPVTDQLSERHACYYLTLLAQQTQFLQQDRPHESLRALDPDMDNLRLAWQTGLTLKSVDLLSAALSAFSLYYQLHGLTHEAEAVMQSTLTAAAEWGDEGMALATRAALEAARFQNRLGRYRAAIETLETALALAAQGEDRWAEGMGCVRWGESLWRLGEIDLAQSKLTQALGIAQSLPTSSDATLLLGWSHHHLGVLNDSRRRYAAAHAHLQAACVAWRAIDHTQALSRSINSIGLICFNQGDLAAAQEALEQALALCQQLDSRHLHSMVLNNLGLLAMAQGEYAGAQGYWEQGLAFASAIGNLTTQAEILANLGKHHGLLGQLDVAIESLARGLNLAESIGNRLLMAETMIQLADIHNAGDDQKEAAAWHGQALALARRHDLPQIECEALIGLAELLSRSNQNEARAYSAQAVTLAEALQHQPLYQRAQAIDHYLNV